MKKNFLLCVGCQKGGTSWLWKQLTRNENFYAGIKEYHIFNKIYLSQSFIPEAENEFVNETSYYEKIYDRKYFGARFINEYKKKRLNFNRHCFFKKIISFSVSKYGLLILKQKLKNKLKIGIKIPVKDFILKELKNYIPSDKLVLSFYDHVS